MMLLMSATATVTLWGGVANGDEFGDDNEERYDEHEADDDELDDHAIGIIVLFLLRFFKSGW